MAERLATGFGFLVGRLTVFRAHYAIARRYTSRTMAARVAWTFTRALDGPRSNAVFLGIDPGSADRDKTVYWRPPGVPVGWQWRWKPPHPQDATWCSPHPHDTPEQMAADGRFEVRLLHAVPYSVAACRAEQRGPSEWVCDCAQPGPGCKPTGWRAHGVTAVGGSPCSDCPDKGRCERGCVRQQEFISTEFHQQQTALQRRARAVLGDPRKSIKQEPASGVTPNDGETFSQHTPTGGK